MQQIRDYVHLVDQRILSCLPDSKKIKGICILALGGYGDGYLAPFSDTDILFLLKEKPNKTQIKTIENIQKKLWDLKISPSFSVRTVDDCVQAMKDDLHFLTALLTRRRLYGNALISYQLTRAIKKYKKQNSPEKFIRQKLMERDKRHLKTGDTRYELEPNLKEGKGGLRDIQNLFWITRYLYDISTADQMVQKKLLTKTEAKTLQSAHSFLWQVRTHLHHIADRAEERLLFEYQPQIAHALGYQDKEPNIRAENFMRDYFKTTRNVGYLTRIICAKLESQTILLSGTSGTRKAALNKTQDGFPLKYNRLTLASQKDLVAHPENAIRIFKVAQKTKHDIHPDALRFIQNSLKTLAEKLPRNAKALTHFKEIILSDTSPERSLRQLNEAGLIMLLIPEFSNIYVHMQYDMYHKYTADEHTLRAIGFAHQIEKRHGKIAMVAPLATKIFTRLKFRESIYFALLFHDIAKGTGKNHSREGARIFRKHAKKFNLNKATTSQIVWLIEHHLLMSRTAFKKDLNDPQTIEDFTHIVSTVDQLNALTILTTADIMAVGQSQWNSWKANLIQSLYQKAYAHITGNSADIDAVETIAALQKQTRRKVGRNKDSFYQLCDFAPNNLWFNHTPETIAAFSKAISGKLDKTVIETKIDLETDSTQVMIYTKDGKGLFATLTGAIAAAGGSIFKADIYTLNNGLALDIFQIQTPKGNAYENTTHLKNYIIKALKQNLDIDKELLERQKDRPRKERLFAHAPSILIDNNASDQATLIEITATDRPGLLYDISRCLSKSKLQIQSAKIMTQGSRATDVFYVKNVFGLKVTQIGQCRAIEKKLYQALTQKTHANAA
jgi:[protein-PII] uridylyltransferase